MLYCFNQVGSFLMGWLGIVFKGNISHVSEHLAIGLTTGYLGSLTTFSGWNQKMLDLAIDGKWVHAFCGFFIGNLVTSMLLFISVSSTTKPKSHSKATCLCLLQACFLQPIPSFLVLKQLRALDGFCQGSRQVQE